MAAKVLTSEGIVCIIPAQYVKYFETLSNMLEDCPESDEAVPLADIGKPALDLALRYVEKFDKKPIAPGPEENLGRRPMEKWETDIIEEIMTSPLNVDPETGLPKAAYFLYLVQAAASFLTCKVFLDCLVMHGAIMYETLDDEGFRKYFAIPADL